jgi:3-oxoacyl-[acyl-carrier-protein] synthase I
VKEVYISGYNIITPLGFTAEENAGAMTSGKTAIDWHDDKRLSPTGFHASIIGRDLLRKKFSDLGDPDNFTDFEQLAISSVNEALKTPGFDPDDPRTLFILSTTKGNIDLLRNDPSSPKLMLWNTAKQICNFFGFINEPLVVSQACISGIQALIAGTRLIRSGSYDHVVVNGTDIISEFVLSGFNSFKSLSTGPCRPFDKTRDGLSLGEGSGTIVLSASCNDSSCRIVAGEGFSMNDANHISGPSRTGEGLFLAIKRVLETSATGFDYISAHGTATPYNDEMEAVAITRSELHNVPVNSLKGYWGHTLGAAGVIESAMTIYSMEKGILFGTMGYKENGISFPLNIIRDTIETRLRRCLKVGSGFGGCNAAIPFYRP